MRDTGSGPDEGAAAPPAPDAERVSNHGPEPDRDHEALAELRTMLVGQEREQLASILARLDDRAERRREIGEVLPHVLIEHASDPRFTQALTPPVEHAITASVRRNPGPLADALFPVMGPAIRKAVAAALAGMLETLNRTLDQSLSWRSIAWRLEALRTRKSFGEVMLLHTLAYRVEQLFLIDRTSGLLLQHVTGGTGDVRDADMVSGMLTAIRDFVKDSFHVGDTESLDTLKVGELSVWIEQGPRAIVAAVLRGTPPHELRTALQAALEQIHLEFADAFERFSGDVSAFDGARPALEACLRTEYRASAAPSHRALWIVAAAGAIALLVWAGFSIRSRARWNHYLDALRNQPGIVVVSSGRRAGRYAVSGLRDPLARDPASLLAESKLTPGDVDATWESYHAASPSLAVARARQVLQPPDGVVLDLKDGVLSAVGAAPPSWIALASRLAPLIPGVSRFDASAASNDAVQVAIARMEGLSPLFAKGQAALAQGQDEVLRQLVARTAEMAGLAASVGRRFRVDVIGHTDADGRPDANLPLSRARAAVVRAALMRVAGERLEIVEVGVGSDDQVARSDSEADKQRNRCVTVQVKPLSASSATGDVRR